MPQEYFYTVKAYAPIIYMQNVDIFGQMILKSSLLRDLKKLIMAAVWFCQSVRINNEFSKHLWKLAEMYGKIGCVIKKIEIKCMLLVEGAVEVKTS